MPRDKTESHKRIIEAAKQEFLKYGYNDASLRRIASNAGIQVGGLYKHFASKEALFESLVTPAIQGFYQLYYKSYSCNCIFVYTIPDYRHSYLS